MKDIVWEIALIGSMVFVSSLLLHYLAYRKGLLSVWNEDGEDQVQSEEVTDEQRESESNPLIQKWLAFGGGYYGIIAFVKLLIIEFRQLQDLVNNWQGVEALAEHLPQSLQELSLDFYFTKIGDEGLAALEKKRQGLV